ncbi:protein FAN-like isoform X3 [Procambarus clarkii]|uniref:protein FAN isoform X3 n=1 Tax=Procambarus clarkii TaxID=6728 RepID=UPI001E674136|nr:protein FAN-like isoform X3 [Procambarus clarkii]
MDGVDRFSLLLLEPGEIYFEDFAAIYILPEESANNNDGWAEKFENRLLRGRLKVCSKSLVFDPRDMRAPIIKFPFRTFERVEESKTTLTNELLYSEGEKSVVEVTCSMTVEMLEGGVLQPYKFCREEHKHKFQLIYAEIQAIVRSRQSRQKFDRALLEDLSETEIFETKANKVTPLVTNPGTVLLTTSMLYFQPHNNADKQYPVIKIGLSHIRQIIKRRYLLRQVGLEVFCRDQCMVKHLLLTFKESECRDKLYKFLTQQERVNMDDMRQDNMSYQWQAGAISNYDYLSYLNSQADRSENDLTQYPVFPWVLANYVSETLDLSDPGIYRDLSKPIGALNEERLKRLKERCKDMPEPRFLYGSHYSTPGFVLFYLVRQYPQYMLCLQNGRFDHPDRMFNSLAETWCNVTTNPSDFKELIPNFYNLDGSADFLTNSLRINFGVRQNGKPVADVELPPWAKDSRSVIKIMREALESEHVSNNLHFWIDLIFGFKQNGEEAEKADNLFYHLCYEGSVDLAAITDLNDRLALEVQITEFGQVPKQLFCRPHPRRSRSYGLYDSLHLNNVLGSTLNFVEDSAECNESCVGGSSLTVRNLWQRLTDLQQLQECKGHRDVVMGVAFTTDAQQVMSVAQDSLIKMFTVPKLEQMRSVRLSSMATSCCLHLPGTDVAVVGSWDNNVYTYSQEYGQVCLLLEAHCDAVSCMQWTNNVLVTGSWDCTARAWSVRGSAGVGRRHEENTRGGMMSALSAGQNIICEMDHDSPILCVALHPEGMLLATGNQDGILTIWLLPDGDLVHQLNCHEGGVNAVVWSAADDRLLTGGDDGNLTIVEAYQGTKICVHNLQENVRCVAWEGRLVIAGGESGDIIMFDMGTGLVIKRFPAHNGPITCLAVSPDNLHLVTGSEDRKVILWGLNS